MKRTMKARGRANNGKKKVVLEFTHNSARGSDPMQFGAVQENDHAEDLGDFSRGQRARARRAKEECSATRANGMDTWHATVRVKGDGKEKEAKRREKALTAMDSTEKAAQEKTKARNEANTAQRILRQEEKNDSARTANTVGPRQV